MIKVNKEPRMYETAGQALCEELYELSVWDDTSHFFTSRSEQLDWPQHLGGNTGWQLPAYDLGYLLRKLPSSTEISKQGHGYVANCVQCSVVYKVLTTPEDALCRLAIELFKTGVLTREAQS